MIKFVISYQYQRVTSTERWTYCSVPSVSSWLYYLRVILFFIITVLTQIHNIIRSHTFWSPLFVLNNVIMEPGAAPLKIRPGHKAIISTSHNPIPLHSNSYVSALFGGKATDFFGIRKTDDNIKSYTCLPYHFLVGHAARQRERERENAYHEDGF